jgi:hypothetical protein
MSDKTCENESKAKKMVIKYNLSRQKIMQMLVNKNEDQEMH